MADNDQDQKTEQPTPQRRQEAREEGRVAKSQELGSIAVLLAGIYYFNSFGAGFMEQSMNFMKDSFIAIGSMEFTHDAMLRVLTGSFMAFIHMVAPVFCVICLTVIAVILMQTGFIFSLKPLMPNFNRLSPKMGFEKFFSVKALVRLVFSLAKLIIIVKIAFDMIIKAMPEIMTLQDAEVSQIVAFCGRFTVDILLRLILFLLVIALFDYVYQRWDFEKSLRMSKEEIKDELKRHEGNPQIRARIRTIQMQIGRQRMMKSVPTADVVITNPTHYAVAVKYDIDNMQAPQVVAKGARLIAEQIKRIAYENSVPVVENKPLARGLFKSCEVGDSIPANLYQAVAEILAYVYQLNKTKFRDISERIGMAHG